MMRICRRRFPHSLTKGGGFFLAGAVCARLPAIPLFSVLMRKPGAEIFLFSHCSAGAVCARFPANPLFSVLMRKPGAGIFRFSRCSAGAVCARLPANPLFSVLMRKPEAEIFSFPSLQRRRGLRSTPRKPFILRFDAQTRSRNFFFPLAAAPARFALDSPQTLYSPF